MRSLKFIVVVLVVFSCKEKNKMSYVNSNSETAWRYYPYDKNKFNSALNDIDTINGQKVDLDIVRSLLESLEINYQEVRKDDQVLALYSSMTDCDDPIKYVDLYYERAKLKLSGIENEIIRNGAISEDSFNQLKEYYVRFKSAVFNRHTWFLINRYYISQDFFKKFVNEKTYYSLFHLSDSTEYVNKNMYLEVILSKDIAQNILSTINEQGVNEIDFDQKDSIFLASLKGVLDKSFVVTYSNE